MKTRIAALVTAGVLALSMLTGCGSKQESWKVTCPWAPSGVAAMVSQKAAAKSPDYSEKKITLVAEAIKGDAATVNTWVASTKANDKELVFAGEGLFAITETLDPAKLQFGKTVGWGTMISSGLYFGTSGMVNSENFLRVCGAKNAKEARGASLTGTLLVYMPYLLFASFIGFAGSALIANLGTSDSILPAMINQYTGTVLGAVLLAALLAAVMGTAASVTILTSVMLSRDVIGRIKPLDGKAMLTTQRICMIVVAALGVIVGYFGSSIVSIMEDIGAPCGAALVPIFCGLFFWKEKMNAKGTLTTIVVAVVATLGYWLLGSPLGISHFLFGLICSTITMFVANSIFYKIDENGNVTHAVDTQAFRDFLTYFYRLGQEGLLNLEGLSSTSDQYTAECDAMRSGIFGAWAPSYLITDTANAMQYDGLPKITVPGYEESFCHREFNHANRNAFVISKSCKNVEAALRFYDYISEPTRAIEVFMGEQGIFWDYVDDDYHYEMVYCPSQETDPEGYAAHVQKLIDAGYGDYVEKGIILDGSSLNYYNTVGCVDYGSLVLHAQNYDMTNYADGNVYRIATIRNITERGGYAPAMNTNIVPAEAQEEFDFMCDGLSTVINAFVSESILHGVTDESWNAYLKQLEQYNYDYYIEFFNNKLHNSF